MSSYDMLELTAHQARLKKLLIWGGAEIQDGIFIVKPAIKIIKSTSLNPDFKEVLSELNMCTTEPDYLVSGEFNGRLCYLSFPFNQETSTQSIEYNNKMINQHKHLSVFNDYYVSFLIAGISDETMKELLAHVEHRASRLISSKTKAQDATFYRVQGTPEQMTQQKNFIKEFIELKSNLNLTPTSTEFTNMLNLSVKACALVYTMNLKDLKKMIAGRLPEFGNETEIREVATMMKSELAKHYPLLFVDDIKQLELLTKPETHYINVEKYQEIIRPYVSQLNNKVFIDFGCAHGEIATAIMNLNKLETNWYFGWEISTDEPDNRLKETPQCVFYKKDYRTGLEDIPPNSIILSNPPYSELENIMEFIKARQLKYILMSNAKNADLFVGAKLIGVMGPGDFVPPTKNSSTHMIFTNLSN